MKMRAKLRGQEGAAAVEFALVVSLLFVLLFGIMEFGLAFFQLQSLRSATREGARAAAVGGDSAEISDAIVAGSSGSLPDGFSRYTPTPPHGLADDGTELLEGTVAESSPPAKVEAAVAIKIPLLPALPPPPGIPGAL